MSAPPVDDLIGHMLDATRQAVIYVDGMDRDEFQADKRTQQAVILNLIILGEAATKLMNTFPEFAAANPQIEWRSMRGMRNRIAHGYHEINLDVVWETVSSALSGLEARLLSARAHITKPDRL
jgi:uncharacterized protein with HEPN domain